MSDKKCLLYCAYCGKETKITISVSPLSIASNNGKKKKKIQITRYCDHCMCPNIINVPETWDVSALVLGEDEDVLRYSSGIPVLQGYKL
jgi:hypothetical protein